MSPVQFHTIGESRIDIGISEIQEWQYNRLDGNLRRKEQESSSSESAVSLIGAELIEPTIKETPNSPKQSYALTEKSKAYMNKKE